MSEPDLSAILGGVAAPFPVTHKGVTYKVGAPTLAARDVLHKVVVAVALRGAQQGEADASGAGVMEQFRRDMAKGHYRPGAAGWVELVRGERGNALFLASLLYEHHPDVTVELAEELIAEEPDQVAVALAEMVPGFFTRLAEDARMPAAIRDSFRRTGPAVAEQLRAQAALLRPASSTGSNST